jgi:hypothetical protein
MSDDSSHSTASIPPISTGSPTQVRVIEDTLSPFQPRPQMLRGRRRHRSPHRDRASSGEPLIERYRPGGSPGDGSHSFGTRANMLASLFTWLLLTGFIFLPGTFASVRNSRALDNMAKAGKTVIRTVQNAPLLGVAGVFCGLAALGLCWLWWKNKTDYIWLVDRVYL